MALGQCFSQNDHALGPNTGERRNLYKGEHQFTMDMLNVVNDQMPTENIFFSPFSVYNALVLAYFTANNHTEESLKKVLYIPESQDKVSTMRAYTLEKLFQNMRALNGSSDYELLSANRLFVSNKFNIRDCMKELFQNEIVPVDYVSDPAGAVNMINNWVANQTKNQIKDLLHADQITAATNLVLANAAYFKGLWKSKFQPESTRKEVFYITTSQSAFVTMMRQKTTFNHMVSEKLGAHVLELPYKGEDVSLLILLPPFASPTGITNILRRLKTNDFQQMIKELIPRQVDVSIPKFTIEHELKLASILETMGVGDLFKSTSDLSGLTGTNEIKLDDAIHKAKVSLDEDGTTAAAATAIFNFRSSRPLDPARFNCNHPFVYLIFDKVSQTILFAGVFNKPPSSS